MKVEIITALDDNYMYLVVDEETKIALAVDPVESHKIEEICYNKDYSLDSILTTHHHWDHAGGNSNLVSHRKRSVYGGDANISCLTNQVTHGTVFNVGELRIECLLTPCHTRGHVCYFVEDQSGQPPALFTGDTLFSAGCGKFFEGTAEQMYEALINILGDLPDDTLVYCGHEYTVNNLLYAQHVEPDNPDIKSRLEWAKMKREAGEPTVPSTIGEEKKFNPFMRVNHKDVQKHVKMTNPISVMNALRSEKNLFSMRL